MWPFSKKQQQKIKELSEEERIRCRRKCGLALASLRQCLQANAGHEKRCDSLESQVVYCHAEVLCPELARQHSACFQRVVASRGREPLSACDQHVEAMKECLRGRGVYPFPA